MSKEAKYDPNCKKCGGYGMNHCNGMYDPPEQCDCMFDHQPPDSDKTAPAKPDALSAATGGEPRLEM